MDKVVALKKSGWLPTHARSSINCVNAREFSSNKITQQTSIHALFACSLPELEQEVRKLSHFLHHALSHLVNFWFVAPSQAIILTPNLLDYDVSRTYLPSRSVTKLLQDFRVENVVNLLLIFIDTSLI